MSTQRPASGISQAALRGAVDLGALAQARQAKQQPPAASPGAAPPAGAFVIDVTTEGFQDQVLQQSLTVPVVLDMWASWCGPCKTLTPVLEKLAADYGGRFLLAKIDVDAEQQLAAAFQVQSIPSVFAVVRGQPIPLFQGALPEPQVRQFIDEVLAFAAENGVSGRLAAAPAPAPEEPVTAEPEGDPRLDTAADAIDAGDWDGAEAAYRSILADAPGDVDAKAGLTYVMMQRKLDGVDVAAAIRAGDAAPGDVDTALIAAYANVADGDAASGYARLIEVVRRSAGDDRNRARTALLELFELAPADDPSVAAARRALAAALY